MGLGMGIEKMDLGWALSLDRLIELTRRDRKRVVRPVSPRIVITRRLALTRREETAPKKKRHGH